MNTEQEAYRISSIKVEGLFGMFDHEIPLNLDERITIIYGENGIGKTKIFKILKAFGDGDFETLKAIPFRRLEIRFKNGEKIIVDRQLVDSQATLDIKGLRDAKEVIFSHFVEWKKEFDLREFVDEIVPKQIENLQDDFVYSLMRESRTRVKRIEERLMVLRGELREAYMMAKDSNTTGAKRVRYKMQLYRALEPYKKQLQEFLEIGKRNPLPFELEGILSCINVSLIETNRLFSDAHEFDELIGASTLRKVDTVELLSTELADIIGEAQKRYREKNDELESSLTKRLLEPAVKTEFETDELNRIAGEIAIERSKLIEVGLLAEKDVKQDSIINEDMSPITKAILGFNLLDMQKKMAVFEDLYRKLRLFLDIINSRRFTFKRLKINHSTGFEFENSNGEILRTTDLSSGEQHELVLMYSLIFRLPENSLILIDEPEISLHVAWQKDFLSDIEEIIGMRNFDVFIATHSPSIVGDRWELTVPLVGKNAYAQHA